MKFLVDSCISKFAVDVLREAGYTTVWIPETGADPGDSIILKKAFDEGFVLVTADKDFGELVFLHNQPHSSIIRLVDMPAKQQGVVLMKVIGKYEKEIKGKAVFTVTAERTRIRKENK